MRIAMVGSDFDFSSKDGISRYAYELYRRIRKSNSVSTYCFKKEGGFIGNALHGFDRLFIGAKIANADIVHVVYPNTAVVRSTAPQVLTWHDTALFTRYRTRNIFSGKFYHHLGVVLPAVKNTKNASGIIYVSDKTKESVERLLPESAEKPNKVIYEGIDEEFVKSEPVGDIARKDFVYVGSVQYKHKNVDFLIRSFLNAKLSGEDLYIFTPTDKSLIPSRYFGIKNIHIIINASTKEIVEKLKRSIALLHFSKLEGFGLTILESMAVGTPVLILKHASIPKAVSKYAWAVEEQEVVEKLRELSKNPEPLSRKAIMYAKSFSWDSAAKNTLSFYREILETKAK